MPSSHHRPAARSPRSRGVPGTDVATVAILLALVGGGLALGVDAALTLGAPATPSPPATASPATAGGDPTALPSGTGAVTTPLPSATPAPPSPPPIRAPVDVALLDPAQARRAFVSELTDRYCAAAAIQMTVSIVSGRIDTSAATQRRDHALAVSLTTTTDSHNGGTGPAGMAAAISRLASVPYELRIGATRAAAVRDAAATIERTGRPVVLLAWRGAHAWVMTGFRADADPAAFPDATVTGAYVLDPWYPRVSSIWGRSDPPGTFQDARELVRNYLPWKRPEGRYPGRDGRFLYLAPAENPGG